MRGHTECSMSEQSVSQEVHDELFKYTGDAVVLLVSSSLLKALILQALLMFDHHMEIRVAPAAMVLIT